jgi:hypothetical protein
MQLRDVTTAVNTGRGLVTKGRLNMTGWPIQRDSKKATESALPSNPDEREVT